MRTNGLAASAAALCALAALLTPAPTLAHSGRTNAQGCHTNRSTGDYHCHNSGRSSGASARPQTLRSGGSFANCSEARAAGRSNIRRGEPGYGSHLDRDSDGVACER